MSNSDQTDLAAVKIIKREVSPQVSLLGLASSLASLRCIPTSVRLSLLGRPPSECPKVS
jgi:hypothetical protein